MKKKRIAILGVGEISAFYLEALVKSNSFDVALLFDNDLSRLTKVSKRYGLPATTSRDKVMSDPHIDAVVVALPNYLHFEFSLEAIKCGKHVLCEKPLTTELSQSKVLSSAASKYSSVLIPAMHRRFNKNVIQFTPPANDLREINAYHHEKVDLKTNKWFFNKALSGGGCLIDGGINIIDLIINITGPLVVKNAEIKSKTRDVESCITVESETLAGTLVRLQASWVQPLRKEIVFSYKDNSKFSLNLLNGYVSNKDSLIQEYEALVEDFSKAINARRSSPNKFRALQFVHDAYFDCLS